MNQTIQEYKNLELTQKQFFKAYKDLTAKQSDTVWDSERIDLWEEVNKWIQ